MKATYTTSAMTTTLYTLPSALRPLAAAWARAMPATQKDRQAAVRGLDDRAGLSLTAAREACEAAANAACASRRQRGQRRMIAALGYCPITRQDWDAGVRNQPVGNGGWHLRRATRSQPGRKPVALPAGKIAIRLDNLRRDAAYAAYRSAYRLPDSSHGTEYVHITTDPARVGVSQNQHQNWDFYAKSYGHPATITDTTLTVPVDWRVRVQRAGLAVVDGMMTLDAGRLEGAPEGVELYAATWIEQGRGYSVSAVRGYIAMRGGTAYHGATPEKALAGLRRKLASAEWAAKLATCDLGAVVARLGDALDSAVVRVSDARAIGACEYGIRSWCHATGLDYDAGAASLREVWSAYQAQPRSEARAAILHALRRQRRLAA